VRQPLGCLLFVPTSSAPSEAVLVILLNPNDGQFVNEDGEVVVSPGPDDRSESGVAA